MNSKLSSHTISSIVPSCQAKAHSVTAEREGGREGGKERASPTPSSSQWLLNYESSYTEIYSVIYDSGSVPEQSAFAPRETSPILSRSPSFSDPQGSGCCAGKETSVQGHLAHEKLPPPRIAIGPYAEASSRFLETLISYERGIPVTLNTSQYTPNT